MYYSFGQIYVQSGTFDFHNQAFVIDTNMHKESLIVFYIQMS
jgi:hypothetical protein